MTLVVVRTGSPGGADAGDEVFADRMPNLAKMCPRWDSTVLTLTYNSAAARRLERAGDDEAGHRLLGSDQADEGVCCFRFYRRSGAASSRSQACR